MEATDTKRPSIITGTAHEPHLDSDPQALQLIITRTQDLDTCPFWVSLYRQGTASPQNLFQMPSIEGIFKLLTNEGLKENQPLMLAENIEGKTARQFYLIPEKMCTSQGDKARDLIVSTLEALAPDRVGIHLPSLQPHAPVSTHLIEEISLGISFLRTKELYLFTGSLGMNPLLNAALRVKRLLEGRREVLVYH